MTQLVEYSGPADTSMNPAPCSPSEPVSEGPQPAWADLDVVDLVIAVQGGEHAAFTELYLRLEDAVRGTAVRITRNSNDAADVCQQTWLTVFEKLGRLQSPERFPAWVIVIARRHALDVLRKRSRVQITDPVDLEDVLDPSERPEEAVEREETAVSVRRGMALLAPERARVLVELVCNERSYRDLAGEMGRPIGSLGPSRARYLRQLAETIDLEANTAA